MKMGYTCASPFEIHMVKDIFLLTLNKYLSCISLAGRTKNIKLDLKKLILRIAEIILVVFSMH